VLDELADGVVGAVDIVVLGGEGLEEEGGEGGAGDLLGGEAEEVLDSLHALNWVDTANWRVVLPWSFLVVRESGCRWIIRRARNMRESV